MTLGEEFKGAKLVVSDLGEPDRAFELIAGKDFGRKFVDIDLLSKVIDM